MNHSHFICTESGWAVDPDVWEEDSFTDPRDGREYRTVGIWDQVWMGENLNYTDSVATPDLEGNAGATMTSRNSAILMAPCILARFQRVFALPVGTCRQNPTGKICSIS